MSLGVINKALKTAAGQELLEHLYFVSTEKQIKNGTIVLEGYFGVTPVSYKITANGVVMSNDHVVDQILSVSEASMYTAGLRSALGLFKKRFNLN